MIFTKEVLATAKNEGADVDVLQFGNLLTALQYETAYAVTIPRLNNAKEVLDWGCGNGHFSFFLTHRGFVTTGYSFEPSPPCLRGNRLFTHVEGTFKDPSGLPFDDGMFDAVFSIGVLEHVYETGGSEAASLREIYRVLSPGGQFFCFHFPNSCQWIEPIGKMLGGTEHFHHRKYSLGQIKDLMRESGFHLSAWGRYNFLPRNQLRKLPRSITENRLVAVLYQAADRFLSALLPIFCTNFYFVGKKN
jgi:SAM-dependent methyltransferase